MDRSDIEKFKSTMMQLYGRRPPDADTPPLPSQITADTPDDTAYENFPEDDRQASSNTEDEFNQRYPEPDLSSLDTDDGSLDHENSTPPLSTFPRNPSVTVSAIFWQTSGLPTSPLPWQEQPSPLPLLLTVSG